MALLQTSMLVIATSYFLQSICEPVSAGKVGIVGGHNVDIKEVPFIAAILQSGEAYCVGTIVHKAFILTSASCSSQGQRQVVLVGTAHLKNGGEVYEIKKTICHPHYDVGTGANDICLLKLKKTLQLGDSVKQVRLPGANEEITEGGLFNITGWGSTDEQGRKYPELLKQTTVPVMSNENCRKVYYHITDDMVCAFSPGHDGCLGDTGAPLTSNNVQFGLLSRVNTNGCGIQPTVYTRLTKYLDWINLMTTMYSD